MDLIAANSQPALFSSPRGDDLRERLRYWQATDTALYFLYARSLGGLVQSGRGRIAALGETALTIDAGGCSMFIVLLGAVFDDAPQVFFAPDQNSSVSVAGISIALDNDDWLFFSTDQVPQAPTFERLPRD